MILVTCGSSHLPFDRMVAAVGGLHGDEPVVIQHGPSSVRVEGARNLDFVSMDKLTGLVRDARVVVTHAGVGSILLALTNGKHPLVVPRLASRGEAVDDHQVECARRFARAGLVTLVEDPEDLPATVANASDRASSPLGGDLPLVDELRAYVQAAVAR